MNKESLKLWLLAAVPVLAYFAYFFHFSINAPQFDDFQSIIRAIITYDTAQNWFDWLTTQYVEHRIAYVRLVALVVYKLTGTVNFIDISFIGNLSLVGVLIMLGLWFNRWQLLPYFLPVPFILFQMNYHHDTFTAMMAVQNLGILFWALLTFWLLAEGRRWKQRIALLPAVAAVYTSGSGMFVLLIGAVLLLVQRRWLAATVWLVVGTAAIAWYFRGFYWGNSIFSASYAIQHIPQLIAFAIFFCGSYFDLLPNVLMSEYTGSIVPGYLPIAFYARLLLPFAGGLLLVLSMLVVVLCWLLPDQNAKRIRIPVVTRAAGYFLINKPASTFLVASLLFLLITTFVVTLGRFGAGLGLAFAIRYKIYSPLMVIFCYAAFWVNLRQEKRLALQPVYKATLTISILIGINSYYQHINQIQFDRRTALSGLFNMKTNHHWTVYGSYYGNIDSVMQVALNKKIYELEQPDLSVLMPVKGADFDRKSTLTIRLDSLYGYTKLYVKKSPFLMSCLKSGLCAGPYFIFYDKQRRYLLPARSERNLIGSYRSGFSYGIDHFTLDLVHSRYRVAIMTTDAVSKQFYRTNHQLTL
ncbi:hypothetical protein [Spirosoma sp. KUDC1026]|uniref:hypothetical protein n=1 Tax=Spirosoma sp. KUDC1026 TaxID=2745947 RepID=UPI00159BB1DC|nr:hypothetical protein [Spirosoma sp. KUDC1026]QKZ13492.1 hypothetical protein HU175_12950 [Spirosoma sp. KUDC1026]